MFAKKINLFALLFSIYCFLIACSSGVAFNGKDYGYCIETKIYFGLSNKDGIITEEQWTIFIKEDVVTKLQSGFTITDCFGVWKECDTCPVIYEKSKLMTIVFPDSLNTIFKPRIDSVANLYKIKFFQQAVLKTYNRIDCIF